MWRHLWAVIVIANWYAHYRVGWPSNMAGFWQRTKTWHQDCKRRRGGWDSLISKNALETLPCWLKKFSK